MFALGKELKSFNDINFECLIVNDASTADSSEIHKPSNIGLVEILNMREITEVIVVNYE